MLKTFFCVFCRCIARLDAPALAFLWDHQVIGRALLPATAFFEASLAAGSLLKLDESAGRLALSSANLSSPLLLSMQKKNSG